MIAVKPTQLVRVARVRALGADGKAREIREGKDVSLREAARAIGVNPSTLHRWETGECRPSAPLALRWDALLDQLQRVAS